MSKPGIPTGYRHARRRIIVGIFGILALLTEAGFTLLASASLTTAAPGNLVIDSTRLCLGSLEHNVVGADNNQRENPFACEHCAFLCFAATSSMPPVNSDSFPKIKDSAVPAATPRHAHRHGVITSHGPRAPPV
jgi:hypothetical protein